MIKLLAHGWLFVRDLTGRTDSKRTIIVVDDDRTVKSRLYKIQPIHIRVAAGVLAAALSFVTYVVLVFTPVKNLLPGYYTSDARGNALLTDMRLAALEDSLAVQEQYLNQIRSLLTGEMDAQPVEPADSQEITGGGGIGQTLAEPVSENWEDHEQPALAVIRMPATTDSPSLLVPDGRQYLTSLELPALAPVSGFLSRGFDARAGHFGIDIATSVGTPVRAIGNGYAIFADWSQTGGYEIAIQHADGYVSVYKHNQRLLKRVADRVRLGEAIATSGDSGEYSSGPHLHIEIWNNGLAQDPSLYLLDQ